MQLARARVGRLICDSQPCFVGGLGLPTFLVHLELFHVIPQTVPALTLLDWAGFE